MVLKFIVSAILLIGIYGLGVILSEPTKDKKALLDFANNVHHSRLLNWDERTSACSYWVGVTCNHDDSRVIAVRLPGFGFQGSIPSNTLGRLSALQILSLRSNGFSGSFPSDLMKLGNLTWLYIQSNKFEGPLPEDFSVWKNLSVINFSSNRFNGSIPSSISNLTHLTAMNLSNNSLSGEIPDLNLPSLQLLDLSNNNLTGKVPPSLGRFPSSSFSGNQLSPGDSSPPVPPPSSNQPNRKKSSSKLSESAILGIIIGGSALLFIFISLFLVVYCSNKKQEEEEEYDVEAKQKPAKKEQLIMKKDRRRGVGSGSQDGDNRLVFFAGCNLAFDLEDLLRASAEVLGKGSFGTTYKAALEDSTTVGVKRLKEVTVGKKEFELQMAIVGNISHENLVSLRAYYYSKDEKLMVYDYFAQGSVSQLLHGKRGEKRVSLDWESRLRIAIGTARGIAHIHMESGGKLVHGNIKASNIFLNSQQYGCVSDLGLATIITPVAPPVLRTAGYRAPEVTDPRKVSQASDVYSYGVLLFELLTGKSPINSTGSSSEVVHLVRWVNSVVREEWTAEVFDVELLKYPNIEEEMVEMLRIGMTCVARMPEQRPKMIEVLKMVEDIRRETKTEESTPAPTPLAY